MINPEDDVSSNAAPTQSGIKAIVAMAKQAKEIQAELDRWEAWAKEKKKALDSIISVGLPEAMKSEGLKTFQLEDGSHIEVKPFITASIPSETGINRLKDEEEAAMARERRAAAFAWLRDNNHGALIKHAMALSFGMGEEKKAEQVKKALAKLNLTPDVTEQVHPSTLNSFVKEQLRNGTPLPLELFSVHQGEKAEVKLPKAKK